MTYVTWRLTAKNRDQLPNPTLGNWVWATFTFFTLSCACLITVDLPTLNTVTALSILVNTFRFLLRFLQHSLLFALTFMDYAHTNTAYDRVSIRILGDRVKQMRLLLTVVLIIISFPSLTHSFIPGLQPSFSAHPSHCSLSFFSSGLITWFPRLLLLLLSISVLLLTFYCFTLFSCRFRAVD